MIVSPDSFLILDDGTYHWTVPRVKQAWADAKTAFDRALGTGAFTKVVLLMGVPAAGKSTWLSENARPDVLHFDATFAEARWREPWIKAARAAGVPVEVVWLDTPLAVCIERNARRSEDRMVPEATMRAMHSKITSQPPAEAEGATITRVVYGGAA